MDVTNFELISSIISAKNKNKEILSHQAAFICEKISNMNKVDLMDSEKKKNLWVFGCVIFVFLGVIFWDVFHLEVSTRPYYWLFKPAIISVNILVFILLLKDKISSKIAFELFSYFLFVYSFYGMVYLNITYFFSFIEVYAFLWFFYTGSTRKYLVITTWGFAWLCAAIQMTPNPDFVKEGFNIKGHMYITGGIFAFISAFFYHFLNKQRLLLDTVTEKFYTLGKQSAFLLHELKTPLARFIKANKEVSQDAEHLMAVVGGIEMLVQKESVFQSYFQEFEWSEVETYINSEFSELCKSYGWELKTEGFEASGHGQVSIIKLAVRNLVKNAIEALGSSKTQIGKIIISKTRSAGNDVLTISDNGNNISKEHFKNIFDPCHSTKNKPTNFGIGLSFVKSVAESHKGYISGKRISDMTVFEFVIPVGSNL